MSSEVIDQNDSDADLGELGVRDGLHHLMDIWNDQPKESIQETLTYSIGILQSIAIDVRELGLQQFAEEIQELCMSLVNVVKHKSGLSTQQVKQVTSQLTHFVDYFVDYQRKLDAVEEQDRIEKATLLYWKHDALNQDIPEEWFFLMGYNAIVVENIQQFSKQLASKRPQLILLHMDCVHDSNQARQIKAAIQQHNLQACMVGLGDPDNEHQRKHAVFMSLDALLNQLVSFKALSMELHRLQLVRFSGDRRLLIWEPTGSSYLEMVAQAQSHGAKVTIVATKSELYEALAKGGFDGVLIYMSVAKGTINDLKQLRFHSQFRELPFFVIDDHISHSMHLNLMRLGAKSVFEKQLGLKVILDFVNEHLNSSRGASVDKLLRQRLDGRSGLMTMNNLMKQIGLFSNKDQAQPGLLVKLELIHQLDDGQGAVEHMDQLAELFDWKKDWIAKESESGYWFFKSMGHVDLSSKWFQRLEKLLQKQLGKSPFALAATHTTGKSLVLLLKHIQASLQISETFSKRPQEGCRGILFEDYREQQQNKLMQTEEPKILTLENSIPSTATQALTIPLNVLRNIIDKKRLSLVFQSVVIPDEGLNCFEVFVRAKDNNEVSINPRDFVQATVQHGLGRFLDRWVFSKSLEELKKQPNAGKQHLLFIKIAKDSLADDTFFEWARNRIGAVHDQPEQFVFQFALNDAKNDLMQTKKSIQLANRQGFQTGLEKYRGDADSEFVFARLQNEIRWLKLDSVYVDNLLNDVRERRRFKELVSTCNASQIRIITPFVESDMALKMFDRLGVKGFQGYFLQKPHPSLLTEDRKQIVS